MIELPPDLVQVNLGRIEKRRQIIYEQAFLPACDAVLTPEAFEALLLRVGNLVWASREALVESLRYLAGSVLSRRYSILAAWRLAANADLLRQGAPARPWTSQYRDEWVPVEVLRCDIALNRRKERVFEFTLCVLAGSPCGLRTTISWARRVCFILSRRLGYSRRGGKFVYIKPYDLVGLRFYGQALAARSTTTPFIREVVCPPAMVAWNRKTVLRLRCRAGVQCPNGWRHSCNVCPVGYEECAAATHFKTYVSRTCGECNNAAAIFDPESRSPVCIACTERRVIRGEVVR